MPTLDKTITRLNHLLMTSHDASLSYRRLAGAIDNPGLAQLLIKRVQQCSTLMDCMLTQILTYGGRPAERPSMPGMLRYACNSWIAARLSERARLLAALRAERQMRH